ncbi:tripartite motif-containing protein 46 [Ascaphus truei]|uniref:tripartite motif-containing protein 46 n=1 Tax=Ascaphus truei TaxID=8439 RepID=UPI003F590487
MAEGEEMQAFTSIMDALVRISTSMKNMERELLCPVCKEMYKHPVILPCKHNVCQLCASEILLQRGYVCDPNSEPSSPVTSPSTRSPRMGRRVVPKQERLIKSGFGTYPGRKRGTVHTQTVIFPCPSCQHDVDLGERGLGNLFRNLTLERVVERYRQTVNISTAIMCQFCKPPQQEASKGCTECRASFCNECFKLYHPWGTQKAQHEPTPPTLTFRPKGLTCPDHKEEVSFYCRTCQRLVCPICRVRRTHSGHKITPVLSAYQALREKLNKSIAYILGSQHPVQSQTSELEETMRQTQLSAAKAQEEVLQQIGALRTTLEEKQTSLTRDIAEQQRERLYVLEVQVLERQALLESSGLVCYAQEVMKETDQPCFVLAAKQLHERMLRAIESVQSFQSAACVPLPPFKLDVSREMKILTDLTFVRVPDAPVIDTQRTYAYDQIFLSWRLPQDSAPAWHYTVEYRRTDPKPKALKLWQRREEIWGVSTVLESPDTNSVYVLRVRGYNKAGFGEYSEDIYLHTPPAQDATLDASPAFSFLTIGMGKILQPHSSSLSSRDPTGCTIPLPPRLGLCLDYEKSRLGFYDAVSLRSLWESNVDCSGPVCPAFCFIGGGALQLQELVAIRNERKVTIGGLTKAE